MATEVSKNREGGIQTGYGLDLHGPARRRSSWADFANGHQEYGGPGTLYRNRLLGNAPTSPTSPAAFIVPVAAMVWPRRSAPLESPLMIPSVIAKPADGPPMLGVEIEIENGKWYDT